MTNKPAPSSLASTLSQLSKTDLQKRDVFGRNILHLLVLANKSDLVRSLLRNPEIKSIIKAIDYENGWNCLHLIIFHKRVLCFRAVVDYLTNTASGSVSVGVKNVGGIVIANNTLLFELLKTKDRNRLTPLQLISNDFKDLLWVPDHIDENDQFHLKYRFACLKEPSSETHEEGKALQERPFLRSFPHNWWSQNRGGSEIFMFGSNTNNNLGVGDSTDRLTPSRIPYSYFRSSSTDSLSKRLQKPRFRLIRISKYHSVIVTQNGEAFTCGIGSRGRLGHGPGDLNNYFRFKRVDFFSSNPESDHDRSDASVIDAVVSHSHTVVLLSTNTIFCWGFNNYSQLGVETSAPVNAAKFKDSFEAYESTPREVIDGDLRKNTQPIKGLSASKIHSLAFTKNSIFFWGLNIGQMGFTSGPTDIDHRGFEGKIFKGSIQATSKEFSLKDEIKLVATSETCTCAVTVQNDIHIFHQTQHVKLAKIPGSGSSDSHFDLFKPSKLTLAAVIKKICMQSEEAIVLLLENGNVLSFKLAYEVDSLKLSRNVNFATIWKAYDEDMRAIDVDVSSDGSVVLCTRNGSVFIKTTKNSNGVSKRKNSMSGFVLPIAIAKNKFKKLDNVNRILNVSCDDTFSSFGFVRDEVDLLPLKLKKNDFFRDMEYLSNLEDTDLYRKQNQLLSSETCANGYYISDFLYPESDTKLSAYRKSHFYAHLESHAEDEDDEDHLVDQFSSVNVKDSHRVVKDTLFETYMNRYVAAKKRRVKSSETFNYFSDTEIFRLSSLLKSDNSFLEHKLSNELLNLGKNYDGYIKFIKAPSIVLGIHKDVFIQRSRFCKTLFYPKNDGEYFIDQGIRGNFNPNSSVLTFETDVNWKSVLIFVHFIYSNRVMSVWEEYPSGIKCPPEIKQLKNDFDILVDIFQVSDLFGKLTKDEVFSNKIQSMAPWNLENDPHTAENTDVVVKLSDGESLMCHSFMLISRSAFFETLLSNRWGESDIELTATIKTLNFEDMERSYFEVVLKHIYGCSDADLFNDWDFSNHDEFVNSMLDFIEIADHMLLFDLKNICQLAVKDFISLENVLSLIVHAENLNAQKLFLNCCWLIYNNLEIVLFNSLLNDLDEEVLQKLENQLVYFQQCKSGDSIITEDVLKTPVRNAIIKDWFQEHADLLTGQFSSNIMEFNEHFMSDRKGFTSFEPLLDVKYQLKLFIDVKKRNGRKSTSRKNSTNVNAIADIRDSLRNTSNPTNGSKENDYAIDDNTDNDFELVVNAKRRSKSKTFHKNLSPTPPLSHSVAQKTSLMDEVTPSRKTSWVNSMTSLSTDSISTTKFDKEQRSLVIEPKTLSGLSTRSNWAAKLNGSSILKDPKPVGTSLPVLGHDILSELTRKKPDKLKMTGPVRLSQKERKKLALKTITGLSSVLTQSRVTNQAKNPEFTNPWAKSPLDENVGSSSNALLSKLPILGQTQKDILKPKKFMTTIEKSNSMDSLTPPSDSGYSTPSLTEIMIQESLKLEEKASMNQTRSLLEIQQEQEFAKWWEEEAAKVQKELGNISLGTNTDFKRKRESSKAGKGPKKGPLRGNKDGTHVSLQ